MWAKDLFCVLRASTSAGNFLSGMFGVTFVTYGDRLLEMRSGMELSESSAAGRFSSVASNAALDVP